MASLGSYTRSAARATYSAYRRVPIRWRLAGGSAVLTFVILAGFAAIVGVLTTRQVRTQFNNEVDSAATQLQQELHLRLDPATLSLDCNNNVHLADYAAPEHAQIRVYDLGSGEVLCNQSQVLAGAKKPAATGPNFPLPLRTGTFTELGYRVIVRRLRIEPEGEYMLLWARPLSDVDHTLYKVRFFLILGVLGGTFLALLAGLATAQRAMRPVKELTEAAGEIERTRDPSRRLPHPEADDEVAELARTLARMLAALTSERNQTEAMLARQREFVADASHELRTPLTSVLANLELLAEELNGEQAETAQAALRSTRRMRRLVGDLLLLARADAERAQPHRATDLADVVIEAAAELEPVSDDSELTIDVHPAVVAGVRDDLHRLALNLLENAVRHTPPGTHIHATTSVEGQYAMLIVEDDGPGIPEDLRDTLFDRFVRGGNDGGPPTHRGSGLGLAIVRAVAESHGGTVSLEPPVSPGGTGTRFVIRIPAEPAAVERPNGATANGHTSTTTGSTIGRRRNRS
ncbi:MAG TPA: HAMP domain-containing sensor histidine kinase [Solirubrobacteraceae bacterium]|nr:HAMP domain-containing sensor histidine kinase [Solirubrobacteraceae bacterium]